MSASALSSVQTNANGLRRINIRHDLYKVADLLELAFGNTLDSNARAMLREMRMLSRSGPLLWAIAGLDKAMQGLMRGFVWIENQQIIGNVSLYPAGYEDVWAIANVAVHPDYRRRGIAREMMLSAIADAQARQASKIILQVEASNDGASHLYEDLGFKALRTFTRWKRRSYYNPPLPLHKMPPIKFRKRSDWQAQFKLAENLRPDSRGGIGWLRPMRVKEFKPSFWHFPLSMDQTLHWVVRDEVDQRLQATVRADTSMGQSYARLDLFVDDPWQGQLEKPLLNYLIRFFYDRNKGVFLQHPSDDHATRAVFHEYEFEATHHLVHMELQL